MPGLLKKRSINLSGHATSLALEPEFWVVLDAMTVGGTLAALIGRIDKGRGGSTAGLRLPGGGAGLGW